MAKLVNHAMHPTKLTRDTCLSSWWRALCDRKSDRLDWICIEEFLGDGTIRGAHSSLNEECSLWMERRLRIENCSKYHGRLNLARRLLRTHISLHTAVTADPDRPVWQRTCITGRDERGLDTMSARSCHSAQNNYHLQLNTVRPPQLNTAFSTAFNYSGLLFGDWGEAKAPLHMPCNHPAANMQGEGAAVAHASKTALTAV
jgi:hypothetical protein